MYLLQKRMLLVSKLVLRVNCKARVYKILVPEHAEEQIMIIPSMQVGRCS